MLKRLRLSNFQKHQSLDLDFTDGLNLVVGKNWAGKTTIQRAILYALFGSSAVPVKASSLVTQSSSDPMLVELEIGLNDGVYTVQRGTKGALLQRGAGVLASGQTAVTAAVEDLLGIDAKSFTNFQVARQNEAASILTLGSGKLNQHIEAVCGVTLVDDAVAYLKERIAENKLLDDQAAALDARMEVLVTLLEDLSDKLSNAKAEHDQKLALCAQAADAFSNSTREIARLTASVNEFLSRKQARATLHDVLATLPEVAPPAPGELETATQQFDYAKAQAAVYRSAAAAYAQALREVESAEAAAAESSRGLIPSAQSPEQIESALSIARDDESVARQAYLAAVAERDSSVCPACSRPFESDKDHASLEALVAAAQITASAKADAVTALNKALSEAFVQQRRQDQHQAALQRLGEARLRLAQIDPPHEIDEAALASLSQHCEALRTRQNQHNERARLLEQWLALPEPGVDESALLSQAHAQAEPLRKALADAENATLRSEFAVKEANTELSRASSEAENLRMQRETLAQAQGDAQRRKALVKVLTENRESFMASAWQRLLSSASDFASAATDGAVTGLHREDDAFFFYEVEDGEGELRPIELASGHQQAVLGVGIKLALGAAVGAAFDVVLLDEVSAGATDELSLMMTRALKEQTAQCLLITHRAADAALADHVIAL
ncbi:MAG: hypothetical protein EOM21_13680 [Gammaproteobacteria bacterium]|nr:hypothetical protein [Gammaproteobacteria bacterium]